MSSGTDIVMPPKLRWIGSYVLRNAVKLVKVDLRTCAQLIEIGCDVLRCCDALLEVVLPSTVVRVGSGFAADCRSLARIDLTECGKLRYVGPRIGFKNMYGHWRHRIAAAPDRNSIEAATILCPSDCETLVCESMEGIHRTASGRPRVMVLHTDGARAISEPSKPPVAA
jgi:hypothetical protein